MPLNCPSPTRYKSMICTASARSACPRKVPPTRANRAALSVASQVTEPALPVDSRRAPAAQPAHHRGRGRGGRIDQAHRWRQHRANGRGQHRKVRAAEHQGIGRVVLHENRVQVAPRNGLRDRSFGPAFLGHRHEQGTSPGRDAGGAAQAANRPLISAALDRAFGRDHGDALRDRCRHRGFCARFDDADDRQSRMLQRAGRRAPTRTRCCRRRPGSEFPAAAAHRRIAGSSAPPSARSSCRRAAARYRPDKRNAPRASP